MILQGLDPPRYRTVDGINSLETIFGKLGNLLCEELDVGGGGIAIPIRQKLVSVAGVGFVSPMKMLMSPIRTMVNRAGFSLAGTQRLSAGMMGKPES
jgi:hypothetical protein